MESLENRLQKRMHVSLYALLFLTVLLGLSILLEGCSDSCDVKYHYTYYEPVYTTLDELRSSVEVSEPHTIKAVGKIYFKDNFLFVNEPGKGIHVIDNRNPNAPKLKSFINVPGNNDLAIMDNILYADSYIDLVSINIENLEDIKEVHRLNDVFTNYNIVNFNGNAERGIITDWKERKEVQISKSDCEAPLQPWGGIFYNDGIALMEGASMHKSFASAPGTGSGPGVGGSMARFTISSNHLYVLDQGFIQPLNISNPFSPVAQGKLFVGWDIETIFPFQQNLFIGASSGMHILDITSPATPSKVSTYQHIRSCDPVVTDGKYAYVTLRSGTACQGFTNQLEIINIENLQTPTLLKVYPMQNPHGLGVDNNLIFVCDGDAGLKIYDGSDINAIDKNLIAQYPLVKAYDVIPFNNVLMMISGDGISQFDYSDPKSIKVLSFLPIAPESN